MWLDILRIYWYILGIYTVKHLLYIESGFVGLATPTPLECLLNTQTTQTGLATNKTPQPQVNLVDIAAPPSVSICCVGTAIREALILALAEHVRDRWSWVSSQKKGHHNIYLFKLLYSCLYLVYIIIFLVHSFPTVYLALYLVYMHIYQVYDKSFFHAMSYGWAFFRALSYGRISHMSVFISLSYTSIGKHCCNLSPIHTFHMMW
jgi:hypothetical protein